MEEPIRVLQVVGLMNPGGIETLIMNLYRNIDRNKVQFDFLTHKGLDGIFDDEIRRLGGRIYKMPQIRNGNKTYYFRLFIYIYALKEFFREHKEYHVIHGHMTNTAAIYMPIAKKFGNVTCCIAHSHLTQARPGMAGKVTDFLHRLVPSVATDYFACSEMAAHWIFSEEDIQNGHVTIMKNGVNVEKFCYRPDISAMVRAELGIEGKLIIGNVARFKKEKNHIFLIDIFQALHKIIPDSLLVIVGEGELMQEVKERVKRLGLEDVVMFLGVRQDVDRLMQAMDVFLLPSLYEGLPVVGIEAQASGLPVFTSTEVTIEMDITGHVKFLSLELSASQWATEILKCIKTYQRFDVSKQITQNGYDIKNTAEFMQEFYLAKHNHFINSLS